MASPPPSRANVIVFSNQLVEKGGQEETPFTL